MLLKLLFINAVEPGSLPPEIESRLDQIIKTYLKSVAKEYGATIDKKQNELTLNIPMLEVSRRISYLELMINEINKKYIKGATPDSKIRPTAKMNVHESSEAPASDVTCTIRLFSAPVCSDDEAWMELLQQDSVEQDDLCYDHQ